MSFLKIDRKELLQMIKNKDISPMDGMKLLKKFNNGSEDDEVAVIGLSCRYPDALNPEQYWENIKNGVCSIKEFNPSEFAVSKDINNIYTGRIPEREYFDEAFFNISPKEADIMDPQQRIFLEESWKALESAGYTIERLNSMKCGVFVGANAGDYEKVLEKYGFDNELETIIGLAPSILAARIAYFLNLKGPALAIDTACSSSAVALHYASESIRNDECEMALVGGISMTNTSDLYEKSEKIGITSKSGKCRAFDNDADGTVFSEGVGVVVLKKLKKAIADGDNILCVIKCSGVNQDGKSNGITAPSIKSQEKLIEDLYKEKSVNPNDITYIESHGTGTNLGDPIEVKALTNVFKKYNNNFGYCALSSNKPNIGHTMSASGIAGLISIIKAIENKKIPALINFNKINERINIEDSPFYINQELKDWDSKNKRTAALSCFGFSGTNTHFVIEEYIDDNSKERNFEGPYIIPISAKTENGLMASIKELLLFVKNKKSLDLANMEYTLIHRRNHFQKRKCLMVNNLDELIIALGDILSDKEINSNTKIENSLDKVKENYLNGETINYFELRKESKVKNMYLPNYRFSRNLHGVENRQNFNQDKLLIDAKNIIVETEDYCMKKLVTMINNLGILNNNFETNKFKKSIGTSEKYERLINRIVNILEGRGIIEIVDNRVKANNKYFELISSIENISILDLRKNLIRKFPNIKAQLDLLDLCFDNYVDILNGKKLSTDILFPEGKVSMVEPIYKDNIVTKEYNLELSRYVKKFINENIGKKPIRILEIGAGTGGTSCTVLKEIAAIQGEKEYWYTDISPKFLNYGKDEFLKDYNFMKFKILDIENLSSSNNVPLEYFDVIIATNVLHATKDINNTMKNAYKLLDNNGVMVINEVTEENIFADLTFGLLEGWWLYEDEDNRLENSPLLSIEKWEKVLDNNQYKNITIKGENLKERYNFKQNIIIGQKGEVVSKYADRMETAISEEKIQVVTSERQIDKSLNVKNIVKDIISMKLFIDYVDLDCIKPFNEYGLDSITNIEVIKEINNRLNINLKATDLFKYSSIDNITTHIEENFKSISNIEVKSSENITENSTEEEFNNTDIAIIGMSMAFSDIDNKEEFWDVIQNKKNVVKEITRWNKNEFYDPDMQNKRKSYSKWGGLLEDINGFDNKFFNITPRESELMDPQQRVLLEKAYHAIEDAGYANDSISGKKCGVYIGCSNSGYLDEIKRANCANDAFSFLGNINSILTARISYFLNLKGPSIPVDTACSSSLVAVHLAAQSLINGENQMAIAGGVSLLANNEFYMLTSRANMLSPTGNCWSFDQRADGFVPAEGVGVVVLKRLKDAVRDGDNIYCVIKGSAMNQDGKSNGITSPDSTAQTELEVEVYKRTGIDVNTIGFIETHGSGTKLGDPIEIEGLTDSFKQFTDRNNFCALGAVKANIGHALASAGIAGLIKTILVLKNKTIPPIALLENQNSFIDLNKTPFYLPVEKKEWNVEQGEKRRAAVSSFGISGTNVHILMEEYEDKINKSNDSENRVFLFSAKHKDSLVGNLDNMYNWLNENKDVNLDNLSYTLAMRKNHFKFRIAIIARDYNDLLEKVKVVLNKEIDNYSLDLSKCDLDLQLKDFIKRYMDGELVNWSPIFKKERYLNISIPLYSYRKTQFTIIPSTSNCNESKLVISKKHWEIDNTKYDNYEIDSEVIIMYSGENYNAAQSLKEKLQGRYFCILQDINELSNNLSDDNNYEILKEKIAGIFDGINEKSIILIDLSDINNYEDNYIVKFILTQELLVNRRFVNKRILHITKKIEMFKETDTNITGAIYGSLVKMLGDEYKNIQSMSLDINDETNLAEITLEILGEVWNNSQVCYRNGTRYISVEKLIDSKEKFNNNNNNNLLLEGSNVLLITGASGGIGKELIKYLVNNGHRKFALMFKNPITDNNSEKHKLLKYLDDNLVQYETYVGSLSDRVAINEYLNDVRTNIGDIGGVIHCAGKNVDDDYAFISKNIGSIKKVFEPKVTGLDNLYDLTKEDDLNYFILFSSISSIYSKLAVGVSSYSIANSYMNYFSNHKHMQGDKRIKSICWSDWNVKGIGDADGNVYKDMGYEAIEVEEGINLLNYALSFKEEPTIIASKKNNLEDNIKLTYKVVKYDKEVQRAEKNTPKNKLNLTEDLNMENLNQCKNILLKVFSKVLRSDISDIECNITFNEMGIDSILIADIVKDLEKETDEKIDPNILFEYPSIDELSKYMTERGFGNHENKKVVEKNKVNTSSNDENKYVENKSNKVAVVGIGCHFPGAENKNIFWNNLVNGVNSITEIPKSRWNCDELYSSTLQPGKTNSKWGGFIDNIEMFDPEYFGFKEEYGPIMDPLIRQFLEVSAETINDASYKKKDLWGEKVSVFVGARSSGFMSNLKTFDKNTIIGGGQNFIAAHVSHVFNFKGASMVVDTACSSSATAIHLAYKSLIDNECNFALAGGVEILLNENQYLLMSASGALSPEGQCRTFDVDADGFVPGEGCGAVLLKRYEDAIRDGDYIYTIIEGSAINNDGNTMGVTTPNPEAQVSVIEEALNVSKVNPKDISYIETHGTGTLIGDPIELKALTKVYGKYTDEKKYCAVGSVKTNIGHLLNAAGISSFIKSCLIVQNKYIPKTLNCNNVNPRFDFKNSPFYPELNGEKWTGNGDMIVGVSSFGFGGTNVHQILKSYNNMNDKNSLDKIEYNKRYFWDSEISNTKEERQNSNNSSKKMNFFSLKKV